jgi:hypothetical protein
MPLTLTMTVAGAVLQSLVDALRAQTVAGGFTFDVRSDSVQVDPVNPLTIPLERLPFYLVELSPTGQRTFEPADQIEEFLRITITVVAGANGSLDPDRKMALALALTGDFEKALTVDIRRGGLCSDTRVLVPEIIVGLGTDNKLAVIQPVECRVHRTYGVP